MVTDCFNHTQDHISKYSVYDVNDDASFQSATMQTASVVGSFTKRIATSLCFVNLCVSVE